MQIDLVWICYTCAKFDVAHRNRNMSLYDDLTRIARQVESQLRQMKTNETATINVSVLPFIRALGYNTQDLSEVYPEYAILNMDAVDLAVLRDGEPIMLLEAKNVGEKLGTKYWKQLFEYFNADKARIGILTNGIEYRFYTDSAKQNIMDNEPFLTINLRDLDKVSVAHLDGFTKERFHPEHSLRKIKTSNLLARELRRPSDEFVRYFAKQIHSGSVWQNVIEEFRPLVKRAWDELIEQIIATRTPPSDNEDNHENDPTPLPVISATVIEIPVFAVHKGRRFEATLMVDEVMNWNKKVILIRFEGVLMGHFAATKKALQTVSPARKSVKSGLRFWHFQHPGTKEEQPITMICDDVQKGGPLRQQFLDQAKS